MMQHFAVMQALAQARNDDLVIAAERHRLHRPLRASGDAVWTRWLARLRMASDKWRAARANRRRLRELSRALAAANTTAARQELFAMAMTSDWLTFGDARSEADASCGAAG